MLKYLKCLFEYPVRDITRGMAKSIRKPGNYYIRDALSDKSLTQFIVYNYVRSLAQELESLVRLYYRKITI
jgi:DUF971 family protein